MKCKQLFLRFSALGLLSLFISCTARVGSGHIVTENRHTGDFHGISSSAAIDVELVSGPTTEVVVSADDNILKYVRTEVEDGILRIGYRNNSSISNSHVKVFVTAPAVDDLNASSSADILAKNVLKSNGTIRLQASSSGSVTAEVDAPQVDARASSSGDIKLAGRTRDYSADASSAGQIKSFDLLSENARVSVNSGGSARVYASVKLKAEASSGGDVDYRGGAAVEKTENSGGSVSRKD